jgi:hypothetical protein
VSSDVVCGDLRSPRAIGVFVGFSHMFLLGILMFKGLTARHLYKSFGVKGLRSSTSSYIFFLVLYSIVSKLFTTC